MKLAQMVNEHIEIVNRLNLKIRQLVDRYKGKVAENKRLVEEKQRLTDKLEESAIAFADLEKKYNTLKVSKSIEVSSDDSHEAKLKINQIVREIDKCIALLNR